MSPAPTSTTLAATTTSIFGELANAFKRGIKRDPILFSVLKEDKQWNSVRRNLVAIARGLKMWEKS